MSAVTNRGRALGTRWPFSRIEGRAARALVTGARLRELTPESFAVDAGRQPVRCELPGAKMGERAL